MSEEVKRRLASLVRSRDQWTPVDEALYCVDELYWVETSWAEKLRFEALKYSFSHHFQNNGFYRRLCQNEGIVPADIREPEDLYKIPLIPDTFFKDYPSGTGFQAWLQKIASVKFPTIELDGHKPSFDAVIDAFQKLNVTVTHTSGSSGRFSFFPRDELTWLRQRYCVSSNMAEILRSEYDKGDPNIIKLGVHSDPAKTHQYAGRIGIADVGTLFDEENIKNLINIKMTTDRVRISRGGARGFKEKIQARYIKSSQKKVIPKLYKMLKEYSRQERKMVIIAFPVLIEVLLSALERSNERLALGKNAWLVTVGGWKIPAGGTVLGEQWRDRVETILGIPDVQCRDLYGMSECSASFPECEGHYKHIPHSIVLPFLLDDELKPIRDGDTGRLAFLDPLPNSYPGFIITGDKVKILKSCPVCKRPGPVFDSHISRIGGTESRGCAEIMAEIMAQELSKTIK